MNTFITRLAIVAAMLLVTGCGGGDSTTTSATSSNGGSSGSPPPSSSDTMPPTVSIGVPSASGSYAASTSSITVSGSASDNVGVTQVTWSNSRGGSGTASGMTSWSATNISLQSGSNVVTVSARDAAGNIGTATISITYNSSGGGRVAGSPVIFFSDLLDGPNTGGEGGQGAYVTIYGAGFGSTRGTSRVSIGGNDALNTGYRVWTDTKIAFQLGSLAQTGQIVVHTSRGDSNGVAFRVRSGSIYFVSTTGSDVPAGGSFAQPWRSVTYAVDHMGKSAIVYVMNGVTQTGVHRNYGAVMPTAGGDSDAWAALVAYPGATATIGSDTGNMGIEFDGNGWSAGTTPPYFIVAGFTLRGGVGASVNHVDHIRIVGNEITCPNGSYPGPGGSCVHTSQTNDIVFYGNHVFDAGKVGADKLYHGVYFSTDSNHIDAGWNHVENVRGCRGIQFHSSPVSAGTGFNQFDLSVHDNQIHDTGCDGINFATVDPSKGRVDAYNNVIYNVGRKWYSGDDSSYACLLVAGITNTGAVGTGTVEAYHNTCVAFGSYSATASGSGAFSVGGNSPSLLLNLRNNLTLSTNGAPYYPVDSAPSRVRGSNNLWFGAGAGPSGLTVNVNADPMLVNVGVNDYHLQSASPAIDKGLDTGIRSDFDGNVRGLPLDLGAFEYR